MPRAKPHLTASIPMRDGAALAADVWLPSPSWRGPAVLVMTPYDRTLWKRPFPGDFAWVVVDWRGFFGSKGSAAQRGKRGQDGFDTVEWSAAQPWCDGSVGMWGPSALGRIQYLTAIEQPPHLRCCVPVVAGMGSFYEQHYRGGILRKEYVDMFARLGFNTAPAILAHPTRDEYWKNAEGMDGIERIRVPMLLVGGWYDVWPEGTLDTFAAIPGSKRLVMGPWGHYTAGRELQGQRRYPAATDVAQREAGEFLQRHLRGQSDPAPAVLSFEMGSDRWDAALPRTGSVAHELEGGEIRHDPSDPVPTIGGANLDPGVGIGPYSQKELENRRDVFVRVIAKPMTLGAARFEADVDAPVDLHVRLCDADSILIVDSAVRAGPGRVTVTFPPTRAVVKGLRVIVSGSNHPRYELAPKVAFKVKRAALIV